MMNNLIMYCSTGEKCLQSVEEELWGSEWKLFALSRETCSSKTYKPFTICFGGLAVSVTTEKNQTSTIISWWFYVLNKSCQQGSHTHI